jgi:hopanoid C-3 methylase
VKVMLVQPRQRRREGFRAGFRTMAVVEPLGLEMVAGSLIQDHEVVLLDMLQAADLETSVSRFSPDACGISCSFTVDVPETLRIARELKTMKPRLFVFVGGHHASLNPADFACPWIDAVAVGEGEAVVGEMIGALEHQRELGEVAGLILNTSHGQVDTGVRPLVGDLDDLPLPARALSRRWRRHYHLGVRGPLASLETARGCPYRCTFCSVWRFYQGRTRFKSPERVVDELETVGTKNVFITDDNFLASISRAEAIADGIMERGLKKRFIIQARTDSIARHPETLAKLREAGFATVFLGLEKIDRRGMESINKANTVECNEAALAILKKTGINVFGTLIVDPEYDETDFANLRDYVRRQAIPNAWFTILTPLPGTQLFEQVRGALTTKDLELFDLVHAVLPTRLELARFYAEFARLYTASYTPRAMAQRGWNALFNRGGRSIGNLPSLTLILNSLESLRRMADPTEYLVAHAGTPIVTARYAGQEE